MTSQETPAERLNRLILVNDWYREHAKEASTERLTQIPPDWRAFVKRWVRPAAIFAAAKAEALT